MVSVPEIQTGYELTTSKGEVFWHEKPKLTFAVKPGYSKTEQFAVRVDDTPVDLTLGQNGMEGYIFSPEAKLDFKTNAWTRFLRRLSFGIIFKQKETVTISATDLGSGVKSISYFVADKTDDVLAIDTVSALEAYIANGRSWTKAEESQVQFIFQRVSRWRLKKIKKSLLKNRESLQTMVLF